MTEQRPTTEMKLWEQASIDSINDFERNMKRFEKDGEWLDANLEKVRKDYEKQFVAVKNRKVIANARDMESIVSVLKKKGEIPALTVVRFIQEKDTVGIF